MQEVKEGEKARLIYGAGSFEEILWQYYIEQMVYIEEEFTRNRIQDLTNIFKNHLKLLYIPFLLSTAILKAALSYETVFLSTDVPISNLDMYKNFPNLWKLDMSNQITFEFPVDDAVLKHSKLARFLCNNCSVHSIYKKSLSMLPQITHLELDNNNLSFIHADAFENNKVLKKLQLIGNSLKKFNPEATLRHLTDLSFLLLDWNTGFDVNQIDLKMPWLSYFSCNKCNTSFIDKSTMDRWQRLGYLYLSSNRIDRIEQDAFQEMTRFKLLNVDGNQALTNLTIRSKTLLHLSAEGCGLEGKLDTSHLTALEYINVKRNNISNLSERGLQSSKNVKIILLDDNLIEKIPEKLLKLQLQRLDTLCLDRNPLQPRELLKDFKLKYSTKKLRHGCLDDHNPKKAFEYILPEKDGIALYTKKRNLSYQNDHQIVYIEEDYFADNDRIIEVILDNNMRFDFPWKKSFLQSEFITNLSLQNCSVSKIYEETFRELPNLQSINLYGNKIKTLESATFFENNTKLEYINLAYNTLEFIVSNQFYTLFALKTLILDGNTKLTCTPGKLFLTSSSLEQLFCRYCHFTQVDNITFEGLTNLNKLDLSHNHISVLHQHAFQAMIHLQWLDLRHNQLNVINLDLRIPVNLQTLCLFGNFELNRHEQVTEIAKKFLKHDEECNETMFSEEQRKSLILHQTAIRKIEKMIASCGSILFNSKNTKAFIILLMFKVLKHVVNRHL